jgi:Carboxypeptidase regulatory-like domain/TonB dependent receptor
MAKPWTRVCHIVARGAACAVLLLAGIITSQPAHAQSVYGTIVGSVRDSSGGALPSVTITVTNTGTGLVRTVITDDVGGYTMANLQPGDYSVKATLDGFREFLRTGVGVEASAVSRVDATLEIGQMSETVIVATDAAVLQTDQAVTRSQIKAREVVDLPLADFRNYQSLMDLVPGTTPAEFQNTEITTPGRSLATVVNGTNKNNNNTRVDGATNRYTWLPHHTLYVPPAETIDTVTVSTSAFEADQGMAGGASIQVITKSGTNNLKGSAFYSHNNDALESRTWLSKRNNTPKNDSTFNNGAFAVGGPIQKNRLFYFAAWDGTFRTQQADLIWTVPTEAMRNGDFSGVRNNAGQLQVIYDPRTGNADGSGRTPFPGNQIPADRISALSQRLQALYPLPNLPGTTNNYFRPNNTHFTRNIYDAKVNWNVGSAQQWWAKFGAMDADVESIVYVGVDGTGGGKTRSYVGTIGQTWTLSPKTLVDTTFGYSLVDLATRGPDYGTNYGLDVFGIPGTNGPDERQSGFPSFLIGDFTQIGNSDTAFPSFYHDPSWTLSTNISRLAGAHTLKFGMQYDKFAMNHWQPEVGVGARGRFEFGAGLTALRGGAAADRNNQYAAFLLGLASTVSKTLQWEEMTTREQYVAAYVSDRWQVSESLTLTGGLRWEYYPIMERRDRGLEILDLATMEILMGGRGSIPKDVGIKPSKALFSPSVGAAWRVKDDQVVRAGYRLNYNPLPFGRPLRGAFPLTVAASFVGASNFQPFGRIEDGIPAFSGPSLDAERIPLPPTVEMRTPDPSDIDRGRIHSWNLSYERKLPFQLLGTIAYVGTKTDGGYADLELNWSPPGGGNTGRQFFAQGGRTASTRSWGAYTRGNYHSLQTSWSRPFASGLLLRGAYTWSKTMNMTDEDGWVALNYNSPDQFERNYALAGFDRTHNLQTGWAYELPFGRGGNGLTSALARGWQVNGLISIASGRPLTVTADSTSVDSRGDQQTADQVGDPVRTENFEGARGEKLYDISAWAPVREQRFGTSGRNSVRGPGFWNLNLGLFRAFALGPSRVLQFRIEAFHVTNHAQFGNASNTNPVLNVNAPNFMEMTNATGNRSVRISTRLTF